MNMKQTPERGGGRRWFRYIIVIVAITLISAFSIAPVAGPVTAGYGEWGWPGRVEWPMRIIEFPFIVARDNSEWFGNHLEVYVLRSTS